MSEKRLHKSSKNKMVCGVCGGVAEYFKLDPTIVRLVFVLVTLFKGAGLLIYVIAAIVMPYDSSDSYEDADDISNLKSANVDDKKNNVGGSDEGPHSEQEFNEYFKK